MSSVKQIFESVNDEFLKFDAIENPEFTRPDLCAFVMLERLFPSTNHSDIVIAAEHDIIFLDVDVESIEKLTKEQILYLTRCGVMYDSSHDSLSMFV